MQISGSGDVVLTDIKETSASLIIAEELTGRLSIRDENDFLVAELTKVNNIPMELGLGPGLYRITIQRGDNFYRAEVVLKENTRTPLTMNDFSQIASATGNRSRGQEETVPVSSYGGNIYTFFVNIVHEPFRFPLFGFVNIARGNHQLAQVGLLNWNSGNFSGFQTGFVNTIGENLLGVQGGFLNTAVDGVEGVQAGFINITAGDTKGIQGGMANITGAFNGIQGGFVNAAIRGGQGVQAGFVNVSLQKLRGAQFGFVNYTDSIEGGIPVGFISVVRNGGYQAVEYSFSEFFPLGVGVKLGVEKFYTTLSVAYNPINGQSIENLAAGIGVGSIIPVGGMFFFNPELSHFNPAVFKEDRHILSLVPFFGFKFGKHFSVTAGPSVTWVHASGDDALPKPLFKIAEHTFAEDPVMGKNSIVVGARAAVRFIF
jgi:hypothetical protein